MNRKDKEAYIRKYHSIRNSILSAYIDYYILEGIRYTDPISNGQGYKYENSYPVIQHIADLCKIDMAICICKVDRDSNGTTLKALYNLLVSKGIEISYEDDENYESVREQLWTLRCRAFAHDDGKNLGIKIKVEQMKPYLDNIKNRFNKACFTEVDSEILPITQEQLMLIHMTYSLGMGNTIQGVIKEKG